MILAYTRATHSIHCVDQAGILVNECTQQSDLIYKDLSYIIYPVEKIACVFELQNELIEWT